MQHLWFLCRTRIQSEWNTCKYALKDALNSFYIHLTAPLWISPLRSCFVKVLHLGTRTWMKLTRTHTDMCIQMKGMKNIAPLKGKWIWRLGFDVKTRGVIHMRFLRSPLWCLKQSSRGSFTQTLISSACLRCCCHDEKPLDLEVRWSESGCQRTSFVSWLVYVSKGQEQVTEMSLVGEVLQWAGATGSSAAETERQIWRIPSKNFWCFCHSAWQKTRFGFSPQP